MHEVEIRDPEVWYSALLHLVNSQASSHTRLTSRYSDWGLGRGVVMRSSRRSEGQGIMTDAPRSSPQLDQLYGQDFHRHVYSQRMDALAQFPLIFRWTEQGPRALRPRGVLGVEDR